MDLRELQRNWNKFGKQDPLWAILTWPGKEKHKWNLAEFFETGRWDIQSLFEFADSLAIRVGRGRALDFGCGVGRLTQALAEYFQEVDGVDIAASMIKQARQYNRFGEKVRYHVNDRDDLSVLGNSSYDLVYTKLVLQHIHPSYAKAYIREFIRMLAPDGLLVFQLPSHRPEQFVSKDMAPQPVQQTQSGDGTTGIRRLVKQLSPRPLVDLYIALRYHFSIPVMEMYAIPRVEVESLLKQSGATILDIREQVSTGPGFVSYQYTVTKKDSQ